VEAEVFPSGKKQGSVDDERDQLANDSHGDSQGSACAAAAR
jgi:hypothetical protein